MPLQLDGFSFLTTSQVVVVAKADVAALRSWSHYAFALQLLLTCHSSHELSDETY